MNRGDRREAVFKDDDERRRFLETVGQTCEKTGWQVHVFCLRCSHCWGIEQRRGQEIPKADWKAVERGWGRNYDGGAGPTRTWRSGGLSLSKRVQSNLVLPALAVRGLRGRMTGCFAAA